MTQKSNYLRDEILDHILGEGARAFTSPAALYLALDTTTATAADTGTTITEPPGANGYARQAVNFDAASGGSADLSSAIEFGPCTTLDWDSVTHGIVVDANSVGNMIYFGAWDTARTCVVGGKLTVAAAALTISET